ncbi:MAG: hypothetical protein J0L77_06370 [Alphaproteobacteria bacterium]|nr:hypothetical protein [Alphaproteobacteria bacterium]
MEDNIPLSSNSDDAIKFLNKYYGNNPRVLTAINPNKGGIVTQTFYPDQQEKMRAWLEKYNGNWNIYFQVNSAMSALTKKASREDIKSVDWLHVDMDPEAGQDIEKERARILGSLTDKRPKNIPAPTVIIFSGGGFQAFWKLENTIEINGNLDKAEEAKAYNQQLEKALGGDNCHNIDRIMRVPGTWNIPDERKRAKGRTAVQARVIEFDETRVYSIDRFNKFIEKTPPVENNTISEGTESLPQSLDDLDHMGVTPKYKELIKDGKWEKEPDKYKSRSEAVFAVVCELIKAGVAEGVIIWALTNPDFKISEKILEQKDPVAHAKIEIRDALKKVDVRKPRIVVAEGKLIRITNAAEQALIKGDAGIYQRGQMLVREAILDKSTSEDGVSREAGTYILMEVTKTLLLEKMAQTADWMKPKKDELLPIDPKVKYADHILARTGTWKFPPLKGFVNAPTLRQDGSILQTPGYDAASHIIYEPMGIAFEEIPENPTKEDAEAALQKILSPFEHFPFTTDSSRSVIIAALLTALIRRNIKTAPLVAIDAPTAGTGKSLLAEIVSIIATGNLPAMVSQGKNAEEDEKRLSSILAASDLIIVIDNCERPVEGDFLCSMLTQEMVQARILGKSEMIRLPSNSLVMATGNNMVIAGDMARRVLMCRIDSKQERPDIRQFTFDPRDKAREMRGELVVAGLTILRAYHVAGRPQKLDKIGSFEQWNFIREALVWLGQADPAETRNFLFANDPRKAALAELLTEWYECLGSKPITLSEINDLNLSQNGGNGKYATLHKMLADLTGHGFFNTQKVGAKLRGYVDRVVSGKMLRYDPHNHGAKWYVVDVEADKQKTFF